MNPISSSHVTLRALADFDLWMQSSAAREKKERPLLRWIVQADGTSVLTTILSSSLTVVDRIGLLFGSRELFLTKVCEIAQRALLEAHRLLLPHSFAASIRNTVAYLNDKIEAHNLALRVRDAAAPFIPRVVIPSDAFHIDSRAQEVFLPACGISNTRSRCYFISVLVALCGSEELKKALSCVARPSDVNLFLRLAIRALEVPDEAPVSLLQEPLSSLLHQLGQVFSPVNAERFFSSGSQQDAHEMMMALLEAALGKTDLIHFREIVQRVSPRSHAVSSLLENVFIPSIDCKALDRQRAPVSTSNILQVSIPKLATSFSLQRAFTGVSGLENVEVRAILRSEENIGKISSEHERALQEQGKEGGGMLPPLVVVRRLMLCGEVPSVLIMQAVRFKTRPVTNHEGVAVSYRREKIMTPVEIPFHLQISVIGKADVRYELRSIVLHLGATLAFGHYVTCIPDLHSPRQENGMPTSWTYYNDGASVAKRSWESLSDEVSRNSYLLIYDKA